MVVFLGINRDSITQDNYFLNKFSYAVYDLIEDRKEEGKIEIFKKKYSSIWHRLENIIKEVMILEEHRSNKKENELFMVECLNGKYGSFVKELRPYLLPFIYPNN